MKKAVNCVSGITKMAFLDTSRPKGAITERHSEGIQTGRRVTTIK